MTPFTARTRHALRAALLALCLIAPASAFAFQPSPGAYTAPDESDLDNHNGYVNRDGQSVHSPAHSRSGRVPEGASARCRDGTGVAPRNRGQEDSLKIEIVL